MKIRIYMRKLGDRAGRAPPIKITLLNQLFAIRIAAKIGAD